MKLMCMPITKILSFKIWAHKNPQRDSLEANVNKNLQCKKYSWVFIIQKCVNFMIVLRTKEIILICLVSHVCTYNICPPL